LRAKGLISRQDKFQQPPAASPRGHLLTGKYGPASQLASDDVRAVQPHGSYFESGRPAPSWLLRLDAVREVLEDRGRTLAQGTLCWLLARSPRTVPIPGVRTVAQAEQNAAVLGLEPLTTEEMEHIERLLGEDATQPA
jgi:aryl-alcohol dehydrogenase-like predicted oxidoreductase